MFNMIIADLLKVMGQFIKELKMEKFISFEKLSKKKQKALNNSKRVFWNVRPNTTKIESKKAYKRSDRSWVNGELV